VSGTNLRRLKHYGPRHPPLLTRAFVLAALANAMLNLAVSLFVHLPGFLQQLGAAEGQIGRIMATQAVGAILVWPLVGAVIDRRGRRVVILGGVALFVLVAGLYLFVRTLGPGVYAVRLLDGMAGTMWYTALFTYAADLVPAQRRAEGLAIFGVSGLIPLGLGALFGDVILAHATFRAVFSVALGCGVLGLILCLPLRDVPPVRAEQPVRPRSILHTATDRDLVSVWLAAFTFFVGVVVVFTFVKTFTVTTGLGSMGSFFGAYATTAVVLRIFLGWLPDRVGARYMVGAAMSCYAFGFVVLSLADTSAHVLAAGLLFGTGHGYTFPVLLSLVVTRSPARERGAATAFFMALDWLGLLVAGPVVGYTIEQMGYGRSFLGVGLAVGFGTGMFYLLDRGRGVPHARQQIQ
jgi:MFS family permease